jgi:hypothetical protein
MAHRYYTKVRFAAVSPSSATWKNIMITNCCTLSAAFSTVHQITSCQKAFRKFDYDSALKQAQDLGFAETDPTMDVGGYDAKYKLIIAAAHAYGVVVQPEEVLNMGIQNLALTICNTPARKTSRLNWYR